MILGYIRAIELGHDKKNDMIPSSRGRQADVKQRISEKSMCPPAPPVSHVNALYSRKEELARSVPWHCKRHCCVELTGSKREPLLSPEAWNLGKAGQADANADPGTQASTTWGIGDVQRRETRTPHAARSRPASSVVSQGRAGTFARPPPAAGGCHAMRRFAWVDRQADRPNRTLAWTCNRGSAGRENRVRPRPNLHCIPAGALAGCTCQYSTVSFLTAGKTGSAASLQLVPASADRMWSEPGAPFAICNLLNRWLVP